MNIEYVYLKVSIGEGGFDTEIVIKKLSLENIHTFKVHKQKGISHKP